MRIALALLLLAATVGYAEDPLPAPTESAAPGGEAVDPRFEEKVSYSIGLDLGRRLRRDEVKVDLGAVIAGLRDALTGAEPTLSDEEIVAVMGRFEEQMQLKAEAKMAQSANDNLARGEAFLKENASKDGIQTTDSGLQYRVIEEGSGASPSARDTVSCHYEGTLISGEVFDSSYKRGEPAAFPVNRVIAGWTEALQMMKVGAKWEVFLPADIAYGASGAGGAIGPNETLIFQIELLDIVE